MFNKFPPSASCNVALFLREFLARCVAGFSVYNMKSNNSVLHLQGQPNTEIYASSTGYVCIAQDNGFEDPSIIVITPQLVDEICKMLHAVKGEAHENRIAYLQSKALK
jgi:hypothetical protein